jgi:hypothetical protein
MLKKGFYVLLLSIIFFSCQKEEVKNYDGIWQIITIKSENRQQKPVAFWLENNGETFIWGDGNFVSDSGKWIIDETDILLLESQNGKERDSEWQLSFRNDTLIMEGTANKSNSYKRYMEAVKIEKRPLHFRDEIIGKWAYDEILMDSIPLPKQENTWIEFRDNRVWYSPTDSGVWAMNAYAPILDINDRQGQPLNEWFVIVQQDSMRLIGTGTLEQDNLEAKLLKIK